ncbi:formylglycine-generating enzyme family protein [Rosistilla oblonga]|uniref:formylglycine-generating enzyme family protein n=1 Tax=Rosistilla oblonga TaxID=2527990 RepID=UPI003A975AEB
MKMQRLLGSLICCSFLAAGATAADPVPPLDLPESKANSAAEMKPYEEVIEHTDATIEMLPIPGGVFTMGTPDTEQGRDDSEGPLHQVEVSPFWMGKYEITWEQYEIWGDELDTIRRRLLKSKETPRDAVVDGFTRPTEPYTDMTFGMGSGRHPAICMTQHAARTYCQWLSAKTGRYYRLPTEAEWEYACRAGTNTAYSFGDDPEMLDDYAWYGENTNDQYEPVGQKKPNPWGLYDMHGNVSEWVLDQYLPDFYKTSAKLNPLAIPKVLFPRVVRGGGWDNDPELLRSGARIASSEEWKEQDPQLPQSIWYHTDALSVGFRIVRPLTVPSEKERAEFWENTQPEQLDPPEGE